jgi:hypothetical protein
MARDIDPGRAAAMARGEAEEPSGERGDQAGDPGGADLDESPDLPPAEDEAGGVIEALLQTEPATRLERIESPWRPEVGGTSRIYRGVQKMTGMEGTPAVLDMLIGTLEVISEAGEAGGDQAGDQPDETAVVVDE